MQNLCNRVHFFLFWKHYVLRVVLQIFHRLVCLKDSINYTCLGVKLLHHYLFRVEKRKNTCLGCQIPLLYLFRDSNFSLGNTYLRVLFVSPRMSLMPLFPFECSPPQKGMIVRWGGRNFLSDGRNLVPQVGLQ